MGASGGEDEEARAGSPGGDSLSLISGVRRVMSQLPQEGAYNKVTPSAARPLLRARGGSFLHRGG